MSATSERDVESEALHNVPQFDASIPYWERAATTKWGSYISEVEKRAILRGHQLSGEPTLAFDVGCEGGRWSRMLADLGWQLICADINEEALGVCQRRIPSATCILSQPDDKTFPCPSNSVGLMLCIEVPPLAHSSWFIGETARILKEDGLLVMVYWNLFSLRGVFHHMRTLLTGGLDFYRRPYTTWKRKMGSSGFRCVYEEGFCWFPFRRESNSALVPYATAVEGQLGLRRLPAISPWVVTILQKHSTR